MTGVGFRFDGAAIHEMKVAVNRLYEIWLELATKHTTDQGREKLMPTDAQATRIAEANGMKVVVLGPAQKGHA